MNVFAEHRHQLATSAMCDSVELVKAREAYALCAENDHAARRFFHRVNMYCETHIIRMANAVIDSTVEEIIAARHG